MRIISAHKSRLIEIELVGGYGRYLYTYLRTERDESIYISDR